jgi:hypothetical protein
MDWMLFDNTVMPIAETTRPQNLSQLSNKKQPNFVAYKGNLDTDFPASVCSPQAT